jgi:hypothetical protein
MSDLRERVARTAWISHRDRQLAQLGMKPSPYAADIPTPDWAYAIADAVMAELGLRQEWEGIWPGLVIPQGTHADRSKAKQDAGPNGRIQYRYITDWEAE